MNMIFICPNFYKMNLVPLRYLQTYCLYRFSYFFLDYATPVLYRKYKMIKQ